MNERFAVTTLACNLQPVNVAVANTVMCVVLTLSLWRVLSKATGEAVDASEKVRMTTSVPDSDSTPGTGMNALMDPESLHTLLRMSLTGWKVAEVVLPVAPRVVSITTTSVQKLEVPFWNDDADTKYLYQDDLYKHL
jgi:hypothetical protein